MFLGARLLDHFVDVNNFDAARQLEFHEGDPVQVYLQLVDESKDRDGVPRGRRYIPAAGAQLGVVIQHIDDAKKISKIATQPFPSSDPSIWTFQVAANDNSVAGTVDLVLTLTEGAVVRSARMRAAFRVHAVIPIEIYPTVP